MQTMLSGFCHCCRANVSFVISGEWLRDQYHCKNCGSIPRQRHLQYILDKFPPNWTNCSIHEFSPSNSYISQYSTNYTPSQYLPETLFGCFAEDGIRSENLENLSLEDNAIDIFLRKMFLSTCFHQAKPQVKSQGY